MRAVTAHPRTTSLPVNMTTKHPLRLAIDIGGTFTDTVLMDGAATVIATAKTATTPADPSEGALAGARIALDIAGADWSDIAGFIHGTTLATNALIERRGARSRRSRPGASATSSRSGTSGATTSTPSTCRNPT
jgi:N-acetylglucosamine kinase-like BadF-type ATPase